MGAPIIEVNQDTSYQFIQEVEYHLDPDHILDIDEIRNSKKWLPITSNNINFGFIEETLWLHFTVQAGETGDWRLHTPYPLIDYIDYYSFINQQPLKPIITGDARAFSSRGISNANFVVPYYLHKSDILDVYIKVDTKGASEVPIMFSSKKIFDRTETLRIFLLGWMTGILVVMAFYNSALYVFTKEKIYIIYALTVLTYLIGTAMYNGTAFQLLWPNKPHLNEILYPITNSFYHFCNALFIIMILNLFDRGKFISISFKIIYWFSILLIPLSFFVSYENVVPIEIILALILNASAFIVGLYYACKGERIAMFFTLAWGLYILGMLIANLRAIGYLPVNWFTLYVYQVGVFIQVSVLSMALAQRIEQQRKKSIEILKRYKNLYDSSLSGQFTLNKKGLIIDVNPALIKMLGYDTQDDMIKLSNKNHQEYFHSDTESPKSFFQILLDKEEVNNAEMQLKNKKGQLNWFSISVKAIKNRRGLIESYQGSLINIEERKKSEENKKKSIQERMLAMEHLVLGICHEINTPLGISNTAISHLKGDIEFLNKYFNNGELTKSIFSERLEIKKDATEIVKKNLNRINNLISKFKEVSVLHKGYKFEEGNLKHILEELKLVSREKFGADKLSIHHVNSITFKGYPRAINDILYNLCQNSIIHGLNDDGKITIKADANINHIVIKLSDNGKGIENDRIRDIFNPFYTSKHGSGGSIGLGLFQVFNIVTQLLDGDIDVKNTHPGVEFSITFPIVLSPIEDRNKQKTDFQFKLINQKVG